MLSGEYAHGYRVEESERLIDQAGALAVLHADTAFPTGSRVLP